MTPKTKPIESPEIRALLSIRPLYSIVQNNGQRWYGPPIYGDMVAPSQGCEIYVSCLPEDCYEDELVPIFESIGIIYKLRLMMNFSDQTRGYAYVKYFHPSDAQMAVKVLNGRLIRRRYRMIVKMSYDNRYLRIGNIPHYSTSDEILSILSSMTEGIKSVAKTPNGNAIIEYQSHRMASQARRVFVKGVFIKQRELTFDWVDPKLIEWIKNFVSK